MLNGLKHQPEIEGMYLVFDYIKIVKPEPIREIIGLSETTMPNLKWADFWIVTSNHDNLPEGWTWSSSDGGYFKLRR